MATHHVQCESYQCPSSDTRLRLHPSGTVTHNNPFIHSATLRQAPPFDPQHPLPYPPVAKRASGLVCTSQLCANKAIHSTIYYSPKIQGSTPKIGVRCKHDSAHFRTYHLERIQRQILEINSSLTSFQPRLSQTNNSTAADASLAMELHRSLNGPNAPLTPPPSQAQPIASQASGNERKHSQCKGYQGQFAIGHSKRRNAGCNIQACSECCYTLNKQSQGCATHTAMRKRKRKETHTTPHPLPSSHRADVDPALCASPPSSLPATQGSKSFSRYVQGKNFRNFREVSIQNQVNERTNNAAETLANQSITIVVWPGPGSKADCVLSDLWRVIAPHWPRFALETCQLLVDLAEKEIGPLWNRNVRVWNDPEQIWALTNISLMETYPTKCRKILVVLPGTNISTCQDIDRHIASVTTRGTKGRLQLHTFLEPTTPNYNVLFVDGSPTPTPTKGKSKILYLDHTPSESETDPVCNQEEEVEDMTLLYEGSETRPNSTYRKEQATFSTNSISPSIVQNNLDHTTDLKWPEGVQMSDMKRFLDATLDGAPPMLTRMAWTRVFGTTHHKYSSSTVSHYRRWLILIGRARLDSFVCSHGDTLVTEARKQQFKFEWQVCDKRNNERFEGQTPNKRLKTSA